MESLPLQNSSKEIDISAEKMILFSPQRKKLDNLNPIKLKRPAYLTAQLSGSLTGRTKDPMHETYKKLIRQRHPTIQISLGTIDFSGKGEIVEDDIINFYKKFHLDYTDEQIKDYLRKYSLLTDDGKIDKAMMAKVYYGHHFRNNFETPGLVTAVANSASNKELTSKSLSELNTVVTHRLKRIESMIKTKISSNWNQVRKAFLDIDNDYDGYITAKDF